MYKIKNFEIKGYVMANDGKYYKYNYEINNVYYCPDNIIIDNFNVKRYDKSRYLIIDYFIIDLSNKSISLYDKKLSDSFCDVIKDINKIEIDNIDSGKKITILGDNNKSLEIITDKDGKIISLKMNKIYDIGDKFLSYNTSLQKFTAENLTEVGDDCLCFNNTLQELYFPNLTMVGHQFLICNTSLQKFTAENLIMVGCRFLPYNTSLQKFTAENLIEVGDDFLRRNNTLQELYFPNLTEVGDWFLNNNHKLRNKILSEIEKRNRRGRR